jgi:methyl-accepting chemotaxis protein
MSIRTRILCLFAILSLSVVALSGWWAVQAWERAAHAQRAGEVNAFTDHLLDAAGALAVERGTTNGIIANPKGSSQQQRDTVTARRTQVDAALEQAVAMAAAWPESTGQLKAPLDGLAKRRARLAELRTMVDASIASGAPDAGLRAAWFGEVTALIMAGDDVSARARGIYAAMLDGRASRGLDLKRALWEASEFAGQERGLTNGFIAGGQQITPANLQRLVVFRGRIESAWSVIGQLSGSFGLDLRTGIESASEAYFKAFSGLRAQVLEAGIAGAAYPVTPEQWFAASTAAIVQLLNAQKLATGEVSAILVDDASAARRAFGFALAFSLIAIAVMVIGAFVLVAHVTNPLRAMTAAMTRLAEGDLSADVTGTGRRDEIGAMAAAVAVFRGGLIEADRLRAAQADAERRIAEERRAAAQDLARRFEAAISDIVCSVSESAATLEQSALALDSTARNTLDLSRDVAGAAGSVSGNSEAVAQASEEMFASINEVSARMNDASLAAKAAVADARATDADMLRLAASADEIGSVLKLITGIAHQTNLLALNATIEAMNAGQAGRGFAVVAGEVKSLAQSTSSAAVRISAMIQNIQAASSQSITRIRDIGKVVEKLSDIAADVAHAIEEQATATGQIAENTHESASSFQSITNSLGKLEGGAASTGKASVDMLESARRLGAESGRLRREVQEFLAAVAAA